MTATSTISDSWVRESHAKVLALAAAHQAMAPITRRCDRDGWRVQLSHHVHTGGHWSAAVWMGGYEPEYCLAMLATEAECLAAIDAFFEPADLGSLDPLDVGFDVRLTRHVTSIPRHRAQVTVRLPRSKKHPAGEVLSGHSQRIMHALHARGIRCCCS